jgi:hypothetical protein
VICNNYQNGEPSEGLDVISVPQNFALDSQNCYLENRIFSGITTYGNPRFMS